MSDDGDLARALYCVACDRHIVVGFEDCKALAATARAFIGDELQKASGAPSEAFHDMTPLREVDARAMMRVCSLIARGDTK